MFQALKILQTSRKVSNIIPFCLYLYILGARAIRKFSLSQLISATTADHLFWHQQPIYAFLGYIHFNVNSIFKLTWPKFERGSLDFQSRMLPLHQGGLLTLIADFSTYKHSSSCMCGGTFFQYAAKGRPIFCLLILSFSEY